MSSDNYENIETPAPAPTLYTEEYSLEKQYPFSEDRAWVHYISNGVLTSAVINTEGIVIFEQIIGQSTSGRDYNPICAPFTDGLSYIVADRSHDKTFKVIDNSGKLLYDSSHDGNDYILLGYGDGHFVVAQYIANFNTNEWRLGTIDADGIVLNEMKVIDDTGRPTYNPVERLTKSGIYSDNYSNQFEYLGEGWFSLNGRSSIVLYNAITNVLYATQSAIQELVDARTFIDNPIMIAAYPSRVLQELDFTPVTAMGGQVEADFQRSWETTTDERKSIAYRTNYFEDGLIYGIRYGPRSPFARSVVERGYYDLSGTKVVSIPEEISEIRYTPAPFRGGYAALRIVGADNNVYVTIIDKTGTMQYTPVMVSSCFILDSSHGYIFVTTINGDYHLLNPSGRAVFPGDNLWDLRDATFGSISNGFIITDTNEYYSVDGRTVIRSATKTT
jgi:hypothetical protein